MMGFIPEPALPLQLRQAVQHRFEERLVEVDIAQRLCGLGEHDPQGMHIHGRDGHVGRLRRHRAYAMDVRQGISQPGGSGCIQAGRRAQLATIQIDKAGRSTGGRA